MLTLNEVSLRRGAVPLFANTTLTVGRGDKVGLVGSNGTGKSSLLELILGRLETDKGSIDLSDSTRIAHMAQEVHSSAESSLDYVLAGDTDYVETITALNKANNEEIALLHEKLDDIDGYSARARAAVIMSGLGFTNADLNKRLGDLSGGWRIRANLAQTLMTPADLLLLDEPTNHLDLDAVIWLTDWIKQFYGTLVLISHDREFLDVCCNKIAHLYDGRIELFAGNYTTFEKVRTERLALQQSSYVKQQREISRMQDFVRRFRAKATKARQAQSRLKALERMELIAAAHVDSPLSFEFRPAQKISSPLLTLRGATLGYDTVVLENVNLSFLPGDRFGLLGVNGAGKSTLIKTLNADLSLLAGDKIDGHNLRTGYFSQHQLDELRPEDSAVDHLIELGHRLGDNPTEQSCRDLLGRFNFQGDKVVEPVSTFSGGEKARLALSLIAFSEPNLLLLDEPTNHLDIDTRLALTIALQSFTGALILVSHDQHLVTNTVNEFLLVANGAIEPFSGNLHDYHNLLLTSPRSNTSENTKDVPSTRPSKQKRQLKTRLNTINRRIDRLQSRLFEIEAKLADPKLYEDYENPDLHVLLKNQHSLKAELEPLEEEWLDLHTKHESI